MRNAGFLGRWGTHACPQCLPGDIVPVRSWTWTLRPPDVRHRDPASAMRCRPCSCPKLDPDASAARHPSRTSAMPCHAMPCYHACVSVKLDCPFGGWHHANDHGWLFKRSPRFTEGICREAHLFLTTPRRGATALIVEPCPLAARTCCAFRPTSFSSVQFSVCTAPCSVLVRGTMPCHAMMATMPCHAMPCHGVCV